jgi:peptide/nickel transport system permease protein
MPAFSSTASRANSRARLIISKGAGPVGRYVLKRMLMIVVILVGVLTVTFILSRVLPGSPVEMMLGHKPTVEQVEAAKRELGLDRPIHEQYVMYIFAVSKGDLGISLATKRPVTEDLFRRMTATFELTTLAVVLVVLVGVPIGVLSAVKQNTPVDHAARTLSMTGVALPVFLIGLLLQMLFYGNLDLFPLQGRINGEILLDYPFPAITGLYLIDTLLAGQWVAFKSALAHIALPTATLTLVSLAVVTRITRNTMVEAISEDYIRTAFAYGLPRQTIYFRYALKATMIPMMTIIGLTYGFMLGNSVITEFVFDWPGLGGYAVSAITTNDFPAIMGVTLLLATAYLLINLIIDLLYYIVDPRLRVS